MRILVMGSGGVGGYFGARLARSGCDVSFVARGRQLDAMRSAGLRVESLLGDIHLPHVRVDTPCSRAVLDVPSVHSHGAPVRHVA
jgi:2-dehydropantoate 2-reductase